MYIVSIKFYNVVMMVYFIDDVIALQVGGTSYSISAIRGEENRKRWMRRYWAYRKEQGLAAEVRPPKHAET